MQQDITLARYRDVLIVLKDYSNSKSFKKEFNLLASYCVLQLDSQFIVKAIGVISQEKKLEIELMGNGDLQTYLMTYLDKFEPLSWQPRIYIAWCIAKGLAYLHELGIKRQTLTLKHVLRNENMDAKLCSFQNANILSKTQKNIGGADVLALGLILREFVNAGFPQYQQEVPAKIIYLSPTIEQRKSYSRIIKLQKLVPQVIPIDQVPQLNKTKLQCESTHVACSEFVTQYHGMYNEQSVIIHKLHKHVNEKEYEQLVLHIQIRARLLCEYFT
ncbi:hypothetical protein THRCLA_22871 [Thraustotheca clavata]|uniref:Serine-threonine/tyrosine-protein kinase catalytic domain-containing protein n=1 Tax=Thraustotheca clavata TaxID=74557 RepID=A0A1V9YRT8_9STRA|nr:hypothetical protein THRCLA_22871 [Thraustotheca clavata]